MPDKSDTKEEIATTLLAEYSTAEAEVERIQGMLNAAKVRRSQVVEQIFNKVGKGPFSYKGKILGRIVIRGNTYFFRASKDEIIDIK